MTTAAPPATLNFRHIGIATMDLAKMEEFYTKVLGLVVTDRGHETDVDLVFLSRNPHDHHQVVLCTGRPPNLPANLENPTFGPIVIQISFIVESLDALKAMDAFFAEVSPETPRMHANHGNAWSIYLPDPEGNTIEVYADTPWFCHQPMMQPLDLNQSNEAILAATEQVARSGRGFQPLGEWRAESARKMGVRELS